MKPTIEQIEQVHELLKTKNVHKVHKLTGVSRYHIESIISGRIKKGISDCEIMEASKTMSYREIAATFRCSCSRVANVLANRIDNEFKQFKPAVESNGIFSLETMGEPF